MNPSTAVTIAALLAGACWVSLVGPKLRPLGLLALPASALALGLGLAGSGGGSWWAIDTLGGSLGLLAIAIATCVALYAHRQFEGERRGGAVLGGALAVVAGIVATDLAANVGALLVSWLATSAATVALLAAGAGFGLGSPARLAARVFAIVDGLLVAGLAVAMLVDSQLSPGTPLGEGLGAAGLVLLVAAGIAAMGRAGFSTGRSWVVATVQAPTAVSALLHAGVVNAGALLLMRLMPMAADAWVGQLLIGLASVAMLARLAPRIHARIDLKGQLAASTVSQMAFMLLALALGWPLLAITHLAGHGIYKASRFMGAGAATEARSRLRSRRPSGAQLAQAGRLGGAAALLAGALAAGWAVNAEVLAAMAVFGPAAAAVWWLRSASALEAPVLSWATLAVTLAAYGALVELVGLALDASLSAPPNTAPWWVLGAATVLLASATALRGGKGLLALAPVQGMPRRSTARLEEVAA